MKDAKGRGVIRLGDKTSHGGVVTTASTSLHALGKQVALEGDLAYCPQCKGSFALRPQHGDRKHHGRAVAYDGDMTACGATLHTSI